MWPVDAHDLINARSRELQRLAADQRLAREVRASQGQRPPPRSGLWDGWWEGRGPEERRTPRVSGATGLVRGLRIATVGRLQRLAERVAGGAQARP